ncbi:MAG: carbamoyl-phosphate synthase large subunit [bacterium]|nr:carbamoyl-phosphate synthase large subunit [bacterium]
MPKRTDIHTILVIGAGPIVIGQACEFDYSGTQACKALKEEGYRVILVNSNPATIMTDPIMADQTYIEPLTVSVVEKIIQKERPCAILPTVGGQTALNLALALDHDGILDRYNVSLIGADPAVIHKAEDRGEFKAAMARIGLESARSSVAYTRESALEQAEALGYPVVVRPAFTLGGTGGGIAANSKELCAIVDSGLRNSIMTEVLIEESIVGWKEFELEVMRDHSDNVVIVCSIENIDAMGVHTGDSITVAPAQTLTDKDYQRLRNAAIDIMREIGVNTGGANVQFALNPVDGRIIVIEMNPRVSRSSALASKATGFPIAKLAAKLSVGYTLDELTNDITQTTPACFEPALDYCVIKLPRFDTQKFSKNAIVSLGTSMKSVGEAMAIGRTFKEALQKGLRSLELGRFGFGFDQEPPTMDDQTLTQRLAIPHAHRLLDVYTALAQGWSVDRIHTLTHIDRWFLWQFESIVQLGKTLDVTSKAGLLLAKRNGFSDVQLARISGESVDTIRERREALGVTPTYSLVDTCAAEFEAQTPYYYSTYETCDERQENSKESVMILGSGPNRIGQGIEFDYCCVHASFAVREAGYTSIMVNSNPETVSTDFDCSDRLFFEPITVEDVLAIYKAEKPKGVIVQLGGQTPLNLVSELHAAGIPILGTSPDSIDWCEDRERTKQLLDQCGLKQPNSAMALSLEAAIAAAESVQYPVLVRPSYVIGGTSMRVIYTESDLIEYMRHYMAGPMRDKPVLIDQYLDRSIEADVDCIGDGTDAIVIGILQHVEPAGVHSGDSTCVFPPFSISEAMQDTMRAAAIALAKALRVVGLMNVQFAIKDDQLYVLEVNPRASRTVPFIAKAAGVPWVKYATRVMLGETIQSMGLSEVIPSYYTVKEAVFPFNKFSDTDTLLSPEMKSTGEVMGIDTAVSQAFLKAQVATRQSTLSLENPTPIAVFVTVNDRDKPFILPYVNQLVQLGVRIYATQGTHDFLNKHGIASECVHKIADQNDTSSLTLVENERVDWVVNTSAHHHVEDERILRRAVLEHQIPFISTIEGFAMLVQAVVDAQSSFDVQSIQTFYAS